MARHKDATWSVGDQPPTEAAILCVLMDIRDELKAVRRLMECGNVQAGFIAMQNTSRVVRRMDKRLARKIKLKGV